MAVTFSGATRSSLALLLEDALNHTRIDSLFVHFEIQPIAGQFAPNKLKKTQYLVGELARPASGQNTLMSLINYVGSPSFGVPQLQRGSAASREFYESLDRDLERVESSPTSRAAASAPRPAATESRSFVSPGSGQTVGGPTASDSSTASATKASRRRVFVIRGRDSAAHDALEALLEALDLRVVSWNDASAAAGTGTPHTLDIVEAGMKMADAVIVLFTPDDLGRVKQDFFDPIRDHPAEARESGQARQNVVFEAGWAMARNRKRVVMVRVGEIRGISDIDGLNYIWLDGNISSRRALIVRLKAADLDVDDSRESWRTAGNFPAHL